MRQFKHRQKGFVVQAAQLTAENISELTVLCGGVAVVERDPQMTTLTYPAINVPTPEGNRRLQEYFWLVQMGSDFYVGRPGQFERTYEEVEDAEVRTEAVESHRG